MTIQAWRPVAERTEAQTFTAPTPRDAIAAAETWGAVRVACNGEILRRIDGEWVYMCPSAK